MAKNHSNDAIRRMYKNNPYVNKAKNKYQEPVFNLKISEGEKYSSQKQWFKDYAEYIVPAYSTTIDNYQEIKLAYEIYNDNLDGFKAELQKFCNKFGEDVGQVEEEVLAFPILHNKVNVLKGERLKRNNNFQIVLLSIRAIKDKDEQLLNAIKASVEESVMLEIERVQLEMQGKNPEEIEKYIEQVRTQKTPEDILDNKKSFQSEWEIFYEKGLKYCMFDQDLKLKQDETWQDTLISDRCFIYSGWQHGKPYLEIRNTLNTGFHKAPNQMFVHKSDYVWHKKAITIADAYNHYGQYLSEDDMHELGTHTFASNYRVDKRHSLGPDNVPVFDQINEEIFRNIGQGAVTEDKNVGTHQGQGIQHRYNKERLLWETHIEFKAFRRFWFVTYLDEYNSEITTMLPDTFKVPKSAKEESFINKWGDESKRKVWFSEATGTRYSAEEVWVPRKYEVVRLGNTIYPIAREVPYQYTDIEQPHSSFSLSTFGAIFTSRNAKSIALMQRAITSYFQYLYIKTLQNREMAKYQGYIQSVDVDQIPQKLGMDIDGELVRDPIAVWTLYRKQLGIDFYSGSQTTIGGAPPATRSPGSSGYILGTANEIYLLQQLAEMIKVEISMAMGISPQREASFSSGSNVSDNQQAIVQSHHITEPYFFYHDLVWRDALQDYLKNFRVYCQSILERSGENPMFHYFLPDGTSELFEVTPKMLQPHQIGLFTSNTGQDQKYLDIMLDQSFAFAQNAGEGIEAVSSLIKGITSGMSPSEIHKMIQIEAAKQQERAQNMEQMKLKVQEEYIARQNQVREDVQAHEKELKTMDNETKLKVAEMQSLSLGADVNENDVPDVLEMDKFAHQRNVDNVQLRQKDKELQQKDKEIENKKEEVKSKEKIETKKINKVSKSS